MGVAERIARVEADLAAQRVRVNEEVARLRGLEAELDALRDGLAGDDGLAEMNRTGAILAVLRQRPGTTSPSEVLEALHAAGRSDELNSVTSTLGYLREAGSVQRPARGRYLAV